MSFQYPKTLIFVVFPTIHSGRVLCRFEATGHLHVKSLLHGNMHMDINLEANLQTLNPHQRGVRHMRGDREDGPFWSHPDQPNPPNPTPPQKTEQREPILSGNLCPYYFSLFILKPSVQHLLHLDLLSPAPTALRSRLR